MQHTKVLVVIPDNCITKCTPHQPIFSCVVQPFIESGGMCHGNDAWTIIGLRWTRGGIVIPLFPISVGHGDFASARKVMASHQSPTPMRIPWGTMFISHVVNFACAAHCFHPLHGKFHYPKHTLHFSHWRT